MTLWNYTTDIDIDTTNPVTVATAGTAGNVTTTWTSYNPTLTNITLGNGTRTASYIQIGKFVMFKIDFILGSTSSVNAAVSMALPVTGVVGGSAARSVLGQARYTDDSASITYVGDIQWASTSTTALRVYKNDGGLVYQVAAVVNATVPFTWATTDELYIQGMYQAA